MSPLTCAARVAEELPDGAYEYPKLQFSSVKGVIQFGCIWSYLELLLTLFALFCLGIPRSFHIRREAPGAVFFYKSKVVV